MEKVGITSQDLLQTMENEKTHEDDIFASEMEVMPNRKSRIIPYGILNTQSFTTKIETYIKYIVLKKILESIFFEHREGVQTKERMQRRP